MEHDVPFLDQLVILRREQGRTNEILSVLEQALAAIRRDYTEPGFEAWADTYRIYRLLLLLDIDRTEAARDELAVLAQDDFRKLPRGSDWLVNVAALSEACALISDRDRAASLYSLLRPYEERIAASLTTVTWLGPVAYYLGLLATTLDRWNAAERHFKQALAMNRQMGARPFLAWSRFALAGMLLRRGDPADHDRANELLRKALATATNLGMIRLQCKIERLGEGSSIALTAEPRPNRPDTHGLTPRQLEVLALLVQGKTDRQIAEELFISHYTAMRHVANILNTLGLNSRTAAATYAVRHDLV